MRSVALLISVASISNLFLIIHNTVAKSSGSILTPFSARLHKLKYSSISLTLASQYMDYTQPPYVLEFRQLRQKLLDTKTKGIKVRHLTEITNDNLCYCKELPHE